MSFIYIDRVRTLMASYQNNRQGKTQERQYVYQLKPKRVVNRLDLLILRIYPRRIIYSERYTGPVAAACGRDETGLVGLVLWDKQIDEVRIGDVIRIQNGWCQMRDGELVVSTGMSGKLTIIDR